MSTQIARMVSLVTLVTAISGSATAGALAGRIAGEAGAPLAGMEVRLWLEGEKGFDITTFTLSAADGTYGFIDLAAGDYKLDARMAPGMGGNYGDRWYDIAEPFADGWVEADADIIAIDDASDLTGYDIAMLVLGGLDARVLNSSGTPLSGLLVRVEQAGDPRIHHNDVTHPPPFYDGRVYVRGMVPSDDYRVIVHDASGTYASRAALGPFTIHTNTIVDIGDIIVAPAPPPDAYEPNDDPLTAATLTTGLHNDPSEPFVEDQSNIGAGGDVDWYCYDAQGTDRLLLTAAAHLEPIPGIVVHNPFVDPVVAFWNETDGVIAVNDDVGDGSYDSYLDVEVTTAGRHCIGVSIYPDLAFDGLAGAGTGVYELTVTMGNRRPTLALFVGTTPVPLPPLTVAVAEGVELLFDLAYSDPDGESLSVSVVLRDNTGGEVAEGTLVTDPATGTFAWLPSQTAAQGSPYELTCTAADIEFTVAITVVIEVEAINIPPDIPLLLTPADGATINTDFTDVTLENAADVDGDLLSFDYELYLDSGTGTPLDAAAVAADPSGQTLWSVADLHENHWHLWRARSFDGNLDAGYSPWSNFFRFFVDTANDPPPAPELLKPGEGEIVLLRAPTLEASVPIDPEGEVVTLAFEVATDVDFSAIVASADGVPAQDGADVALWMADPPLLWGTHYFARSFAVDSRSGVSAYSNINGFALKSNTPPPTPLFGAPFDGDCSTALELDAAPTTITIEPLVDADGDPISITVEYGLATILPGVSPIISVVVAPAAGGGETVVELDVTGLSADDSYAVHAQAYDGFDASDWSTCYFDVVTADDGGAEDSVDATGCGCTTGTAPQLLVWLLALAACRRGRRQA